MSLNDEEAPLLADSEPLRSETRRFAPDQMLRCEVCLRANPPTRTSCLYCAAQLPTTEAVAALQRPTLRPLEKWEQGFNVILAPGGASEVTAEELQSVAELLRLRPEDLKQITEAQEALPVARAATSDEAALIERKLGEMGLRVFVLADRDLWPEASPPKSVRALELADDALLAHPAGGGEVRRIPWTEISLLVVGRLLVREIEVEERKGRRSENEIVDAREMTNDAMVLDIYAAENDDGWRINAGSFDFSCLGSRKGLVAAQNFTTLTQVLRERAGRAVYDDSYMRVRHALAAVWPLEQQTESRGWRRNRPGQVSTGAVTRSDNESQFTRYSRLRRHLQLNPELSA